MTVAELHERFTTWLDAQVLAGHNRPGTAAYYRCNLAHLVAHHGHADPSSLTPAGVSEGNGTWHHLQATKRLLNWAQNDALIISGNPLARMKLPTAGRRELVLTRTQYVHVLRTAKPDFRRALIAMRGMLARPGEVRSLKWSDWQPDLFTGHFELTEFKAKRRRKDQLATRIIVPDARCTRMLARLRRRSSSPFVFTNEKEQPWSKEMFVRRMRTIRRKLGIEGIVCYTMRHTGATAAAGNNANLKVLAEFMGHTNVATTQRYVHPNLEQLHRIAPLLHERKRR